jgi:parvulin-like peptidyl-prolyl isomerase
VQATQNQPVRSIPSRLFGAGILAVSQLAACSSPPPTTATLREQDTRGIRESEPAPHKEPVTQTDPAAARIDNEHLAWSELRPLLEEAAGGMVLREVALDHAIARECAEKGVRISERDIEAEQSLLMQSVERDAAAPAADAASMMDSIRRNRGLGETRFRQLLERNAKLRALVRDSIEVSDDEVEQALQIRYGARYRIRVISTASEHDAADLRSELVKTEALDVAFARAAAIKSTDPSSARGGLTEPISPADQSYPVAIRRLLPTLEQGQISPVVALERGFAIFILDSRIGELKRPEGGDLSVRDEIRTRKERVAMEEAARRLLAKVSVAPLDRELEWSWQAIMRQR